MKAILLESFDELSEESKKRIQKMLFPDGLVYDFKKGEYRTLRVNVSFQRISAMARVSGGLEITKGIKKIFKNLRHKKTVTKN